MQEHCVVYRTIVLIYTPCVGSRFLQCWGTREKLTQKISQDKISVETLFRDPPVSSRTHTVCVQMIFRFSFLLFVFTYVNVYTVSASSNRKSTFTDWYFIDIHLAYSQEAHLFETVYMEASYPAARVTRLTGLKKHAVYMLPSYPASMKHMFSTSTRQINKLCK